MSRFDDTSILVGIHKEDVDSIRKLMNGICMHIVNGVAAKTTVRDLDLADSEIRVLIRMADLAPKSKLLDHMLAHFYSYRYEKPRKVLGAAKLLDRFAVKSVTNPRAHERELEVAKNSYNAHLSKGLFPFIERGEGEYGKVEEDSEVEAEVSDNFEILEISD
jgi:hypothetical protein